jgi:hypothetical protein
MAQAAGVRLTQRARDQRRKIVAIAAYPTDWRRYPSATLFEAGSTLQLTIQGHDAARYPAFGHRQLVNRGCHAIFTGGPYDSCLVVLVNNRGSQ